MIKTSRKIFCPLFVGFILMLALAGSALSVSAAAKLDYAQVNYTKNLSLPLTNHVWRVKFNNLNKASDATVTSSDTSVASAAVYRNTLKGGYIYVTPLKAGNTVIKVSFSYKGSSGSTISRNFSMNLSVYAYANPLKSLKVGKNNLAPLFKYTNFGSTTKIPAGKAIVNVIPKDNWTVKAIYLQGLKKSGSGVVYATEEIPNKKVYNFSRYKIKPDLYIHVYNSAQNMNLILMVAGN